MFEISSDGVLMQYEGCDFEVIVPNDVKSIGHDAFRGNAYLQKVILPTSLLQIKSAAFAECYNLHTVCVCEGCHDLKIEAYAFVGCASLKKLEMHGVARIGRGAFRNCRKLRSVSIPENAVVAGDAFVGCNLDEVDFGGRTDFSGIWDSCLLRESNRCILCHGVLENVPAEEGKRCTNCGQLFTYRKMCDWDSFVVEDKTVKECVGPGSYLPEGVVKIAKRAFFDGIVSALEMLESDVTEIEDEAFLWCEFALMPDLPRKLKKLGRSAFEGSNITEIMLPQALECIGAECFFDCKHLKGINIPERVHEIGINCFKGCKSLAVAYLPEHLKNDDLSGIFPSHTKLVFRE